MLSKLKALFDKTIETPESKQPDAINVACLALLIELGKADQSLDSEELEKIMLYGKNSLALSDETLSLLLEQAKLQAKDATSLYEFTSVVNETFDQDGKFELIKNMWLVAFADGRIDRYEEHVIRRVADLIYVDHARFIEAKLIAKETTAG